MKKFVTDHGNVMTKGEQLDVADLDNVAIGDKVLLWIENWLTDRNQPGWAIFRMTGQLVGFHINQ